MRFNEFRDRVQSAHKKVKDIALYEINESIAINGNNITVTIGKEIGALIDGNQTDIRYLRHLFTRAKVEFEAMLESLESSASTCAEAMGELLSAVTHEVVPELVINRIAGEETGENNQEMLQYMVSKKMGELWKVFIESEDIFGAYTFEMSISKDISFGFGFNPRGYLTFQDVEANKRIQCWSNRELEVDQTTVESGLKFLGVFEQLKTKLTRVVGRMKDFREFKEV